MTDEKKQLAKIVRGNDFEMRVIVVEPAFAEEGQSDFKAFDLSKQKSICVSLICSKDQTRINLPWELKEIKDATQNVLICKVPGLALHAGTTYSIEVTGVEKESDKHWRYKQKNIFGVVDNTDQAYLDTETLMDYVDVHADVGLHIDIDVNDIKEIVNDALGDFVDNIDTIVKEQASEAVDAALGDIRNEIDNKADKKELETVDNILQSTLSDVEEQGTKIKELESKTEGLDELREQVESNTQEITSVDNILQSTLSDVEEHSEKLKELEDKIEQGGGSGGDVLWERGEGEMSIVQPGLYNTATGKGAIALGEYSGAKNYLAVAHGYNTSAIGLYSHTEGGVTIADGIASHAEGKVTRAHAEGSHAEGYNTNTYWLCSHAEGYTTKTSRNYQHVEGEYNDDNVNALHIVGNGYSSSRLHNAFEVLQDGTINISDVNAPGEYYEKPMINLQEKLKQLEENSGGGSGGGIPESIKPNFTDSEYTAIIAEETLIATLKVGEDIQSGSWITFSPMQPKLEHNFVSNRYYRFEAVGGTFLSANYAIDMNAEGKSEFTILTTDKREVYIHMDDNATALNIYVKNGNPARFEAKDNGTQFCRYYRQEGFPMVDKSYCIRYDLDNNTDIVGLGQYRYDGGLEYADPNSNPDDFDRTRISYSFKPLYIGNFYIWWDGANADKYDMKIVNIGLNDWNWGELKDIYYDEVSDGRKTLVNAPNIGSIGISMMSRDASTFNIKDRSQLPTVHISGSADRYEDVNQFGIPVYKFENFAYGATLMTKYDCEEVTTSKAEYPGHKGSAFYRGTINLADRMKNLLDKNQTECQNITIKIKTWTPVNVYVVSKNTNNRDQKALIYAHNILDDNLNNFDYNKKEHTFTTTINHKTEYEFYVENDNNAPFVVEALVERTELGNLDAGVMKYVNNFEGTTFPLSWFNGYHRPGDFYKTNGSIWSTNLIYYTNIVIECIYNQVQLLPNCTLHYVSRTHGYKQQSIGSINKFTISDDVEYWWLEATSNASLPSECKIYRSDIGIYGHMNIVHSGNVPGYIVSRLEQKIIELENRIKELE